MPQLCRDCKYLKYSCGLWWCELNSCGEVYAEVHPQQQACSCFVFKATQDNAQIKVKGKSYEVRVS